MITLFAVRIRSGWWLALFLALSFQAHAQRGAGGFGGGGTGVLGRGTGSATSAQYPGPGEIGNALITANPDTRQIAVIADEVTAEAIREVIATLDRPVPQVLIKVVFLEATYREGLDIGLEGGITVNKGDTTTTATNLFSLLQQDATPFAPFTTLPGAGIYSVMGTDFQATLRAISEAGRLEVLSRPTILARNNQIATISVGQSVPLTTGVTYTGGAGNTAAIPQSQINYTDIGIILNVTPFISSDGTVEMIVQPEISALSGQSITIAAGPTGPITAPIIDLRRADTVVRTPDGQTVVIGGLIQNSKNNTDSKIPLLGDIPLLGNLFKRKVKQNQKTELLIFLTPHIVRTGEQLAAMTQTETSQTGARKAFSEAELHRFLDRLPVKPDEPLDIPETKNKSGGRRVPNTRK